MNFVWGSSVLEGSSYSELDAEALVLHGWRNSAKPIEDTILAVNQMRAAEFLLSYVELSVDTIYTLHSLLTDAHWLSRPVLTNSPGPTDERGGTRGLAELNECAKGNLSADDPDGNGHARLLEGVVDAAKQLPPIDAAFYLLTRIAYLWHFRRGNKRLSRIAANIPLLAADLVPISFADVDRQDYLLGLAEFGELGTAHLIEQVFIQAYVRSIIRSSHFPASIRNAGIDIDLLAQQMVAFVNSGKRPSGAARALVRR